MDKNQAQYNLSRPHIIGIRGSGMSAIANYLIQSGATVSGSDRQIDNAPDDTYKIELEQAGFQIFPQDGSGISQQSTCVIQSSAIELDNPEIQAANRYDIPVIHRSQALATIIKQKKSIAVAGTSGKSTVTAMIYHILKAAGKRPSLITGAGLRSLEEEGLPNNAICSSGEYLVFEADESDGTITRYQPNIGVILNIQKDHKEINELVTLFKKFSNSIQRTLVVNEDDERVLKLSKTTSASSVMFFGKKGVRIHGSQKELVSLLLNQWSTTFYLGGVSLSLALPGICNIWNALAACTVSLALDCNLDDCARGLTSYKGIDRRFTKIGIHKDIVVIDDFAHNPAKIAACLSAVKGLRTAEGKQRRVIAVFHPHGFGPMQHMRSELVDMFKDQLFGQGILIMPEIYYAGGSADKSISSKDIIKDCQDKGVVSFYFETKEECSNAIIEKAKPGDVIVSMGARDPDLGPWAQGIFEKLSAN